MRAIRSAESAADGALTPSTPRCPTTNCPRSRRQPPESSKFRPISTITKNPRSWTQARSNAPSRVPPKPRRLSARPESVPEHLLEQTPSMMPCPIHHHHVRVMAQFSQNSGTSGRSSISGLVTFCTKAPTDIEGVKQNMRVQENQRQFSPSAISSNVETP